MKKILSIIIVSIFCLSVSLTCFAEFANAPIVDNAGLLSIDELEELSSRLDYIRNEYNIDVAIYTEETMSGYDAESSADDIYDYNGYGAQYNNSGIIF